MYKVIYIFVLSFVIALLAGFFRINTNFTLVGILYTIVGIMFSVEMSLLITLMPNAIKNKIARQKLQSQYRNIRNNFITVFFADSVVMATTIVESSQLIDIRDIIPIDIVAFGKSFVLLFFIFSVVYYTLSFINLHQFNDDLQNMIDDE